MCSIFSDLMNTDFSPIENQWNELEKCVVLHPKKGRINLMYWMSLIQN
jgi:hypothetical protein